MTVRRHRIDSHWGRSEPPVFDDVACFERLAEVQTRHRRRHAVHGPRHQCTHTRVGDDLFCVPLCDARQHGSVLPGVRLPASSWPRARRASRSAAASSSFSGSSRTSSMSGKPLSKGVRNRHADRQKRRPNRRAVLNSSSERSITAPSGAPSTCNQRTRRAASKVAEGGAPMSVLVQASGATATYLNW